MWKNPRSEILLQDYSELQSVTSSLLLCPQPIEPPSLYESDIPAPQQPCPHDGLQPSVTECLVTGETIFTAERERERRGTLREQ